MARGVDPSRARSVVSVESDHHRRVGIHARYRRARIRELRDAFALTGKTNESYRGNVNHAWTFDVDGRLVRRACRCDDGVP